VENEEQMIAIDTLTNAVVASIPIGQGAQAVVCVPDAVAEGAGTHGLQPLGLAGGSVTGLDPKHPYVLALSERANGSGQIEALASFMTNAAGASIVNAVRPICQLVQGEGEARRRYLVVLPGVPTALGSPVQVQAQ
jgi:hypothetical protein